MMRRNADIRPGMHVINIDTGKEYTVDSVSVLVNGNFEKVGERFVNFHLTEHYNLGVKAMLVDEFRQRFEGME